MPASCIIHRQQRADAGAVPLHPPGPHTPTRERGGQGSGTRQGFGTAPDLPEPAAARAIVRKASNWRESERESAHGLKGQRDHGSGPRPARPLAALRRFLCRVLLAQLPRKRAIYRTGDPKHEIEADPPALTRRRSQSAGGSISSQAQGTESSELCIQVASKVLVTGPCREKGSWGKGYLLRDANRTCTHASLFPSSHPQPLWVQGPR